MFTNGETYEYQLVDILFDYLYKVENEDELLYVGEESLEQIEPEEPSIEYDSDGIPLGRTKKEIKIREQVIKDFYRNWIADNPEKKIWNKNLQAFILVKYISINETYAKAARTYESTKAVFLLTEILENAILVDEMAPKKNNKNQKAFSKMLIMRYERVKLTVGSQRSNNDNVQYCVTSQQK